MKRVRRIALRGTVALAVIVAILALVGSLRDTHIVTTTRTTDASPDVMWELWADVPNRTEWDHGLEYIEIDGPFEKGTTGVVKVEGQSEIEWKLIEVTPKSAYTDRFQSLPGTHTDWHHTIESNGDGTYDVTWRLETRGPLSILTLPVTNALLGNEVPNAVDEFVALAEERS